MALPSNSGYLGRLGYAVGFEDFLDKQETRDQRYWRAIEYGSQWWVGREIAGLWGNSAVPRGALHETASSLFGPSGGQKFIPFFSNANQEMLSAAQRAAIYWRKMGHPDPRTFLPPGPRGGHSHDGLGGTGRPIRTLGTVREPIKPHRFFERGLAKFGDPVEQELEVVQKVFGAYLRNLSGAPVKAGTSAGNTALRRTAGEAGVDAYGTLRPRTGRARTELSRSGLRTALGGPAITFAVSSNIQDVQRNARGQFTSLQQELTQLNRELAIRLQTAVVKALEESIERKGTSTGRLAKTLADPRNRFPQ